MQRYIGLDAHSTSCTFAVIGPSGRQIRHDVVETNGAALVRYLKSFNGQLSLCLEEGTHSAWLHEILSPHVDELVVAGINQSRGQKSDKIDAFGLAESLRTNSVKTRVFKAPRRFSLLRELARVYSMITTDLVRVQNRLKVMYRGRGIPTPGQTLYSLRSRKSWLLKLPVTYRAATARLHEQYDLLRELKKAAAKDLLAEARKHAISKTLATAPGMGPIRVAQLLPIVVTPNRFRTRSQFWAYCGLGITMRTSSDWLPGGPDGWQRGLVQKTRGLNRNHVPRLKQIFKGAALTVVTQKPNDPLHDHYERLLRSGTKPNLASLTIARRVAEVVLRMWKDEKEYEPEKIRNRHAAESAPPTP